MKITAIRSLSTIGKRLAGMLTAVALSLAFAGDSFAAVRHNYLFNSGDGTQILDSQGTAHGSILEGTYNPADSRMALNGTSYGSLPGASIAINTYSELTFEVWSSVSTVHANQYTAAVAFGTSDAGGAGQNYVMMQPTRGGNDGSSANFRVPLDGPELLIIGPNDLSDGKIHHTVLTVNATDMAYYVDGVQIGMAGLGGRLLSDVSTDFAWLGRSTWNDPRLQGAIYEFRVYDDAKSATDVANLFNTGCQDVCGNLYLEVDRDTGAATLINSLSDKDMVIYQISSAKGALSENNWLSITNNYDQDSGGSIDPDDNWGIVSQTRTLLHEQDPIGQGAEDGAAFNHNVTIPLGNIWTKSPFEDLQATITILDASFNEQQLSVPVFFVNGVNDAPYSRSDFDVDGVIDTDDYLTLRANHLKPLAGTLHIDTFDLGDINGDLANNYLDFRLFKADFIAANGAAAWAALIAAHGAVPEPGTLGLLMLGLAAGVLTSRRKRVEAGRRNLSAVTHYFSESCCTMNRVGRTLFLFALWMMVPAVSQAQVVVAADDFDSYTDTSFVVFTDGTSIALVPDGNGGNAVQYSYDAPTGFLARGWDWLPIVQPGPGGPNVSGNRADYQLSFDLTIDSTYIPANGLEIWMKDQVGQGDPEGDPSASLYSASLASFTTGVRQNVAFTLNTSINEAPFGYTNGSGFNPTVDQIRIRFNGIHFAGPPAPTVWTFTVDNVRLTINIAPSLALVVDPASGKALIRNVSNAPIDFDYYRIESTNGSLLTANFNGTTGWNSLDDQGLDAIGAGIGESWDEVVETNSASQLVEQFLLGDTTLGAGQSVSLGAPVSPAILNNQISTLSLRFGGLSYPSEGIGQVIFEDLSALAGDYNGDGRVDAADYVMWRNNPSAFGGDPGGYNTWRANFGASQASGAAATAVPEPTIGLLCSLAICVAAGARVQRTRGKE